MTMKREDVMWDFILENNLCSEEALRLGTQLKGYSEEALNLIINCLTEYHDIEQIYACEKENFYFSDAVIEEFELEEQDEECEEV